MRIQFIIDREKIFEEVAKSTAYVGVATDMYEKVATVDENEEMLNSFLESACNELLCILGAFNSRIEEPLTFVVDMPESYNKDKNEIITRLIFEYIICTIVWKWLFLMLPEKAIMWEQKIDFIKSKLTSNMNARVGIIRRKQSPF